MRKDARQKGKLAARTAIYSRSCLSNALCGARAGRSSAARASCYTARQSTATKARMAGKLRWRIENLMTY
jgi:hypothetical protein